MGEHNLILSLAQLNVLADKLLKSGFQRIVIEGTNLGSVVACRLNGTTSLIGVDGTTQDLQG